MAYHLTIAEGQWSLSVNSTPVLSAQTALPALFRGGDQSCLRKMLADHGYVEDETAPDALAIFKQLVAAGFKPL